MSNEEIRQLAPRQRQHLLNQALHAAQRLQELMAEVGETLPKDAPHLEVVDMGNLTEEHIAKVWVAGRNQQGARGVIRTKADFHNHAVDSIDLDEADITDEHIDRAWAHYLASGAADSYEDTVASAEIGEFIRGVERALRDTR